MDNDDHKLIHSFCTDYNALNEEVLQSYKNYYLKFLKIEKNLTICTYILWI